MGRQDDMSGLSTRLLRSGNRTRTGCRSRQVRRGAASCRRRGAGGMTLFRGDGPRHSNKKGLGLRTVCSLRSDRRVWGKMLARPRARVHRVGASEGCVSTPERAPRQQARTTVSEARRPTTSQNKIGSHIISFKYAPKRQLRPEWYSNSLCVARYRSLCPKQALVPLHVAPRTHRGAYPGPLSSTKAPGG
jgi:hypothetical protein